MLFQTVQSSQTCFVLPVVGVCLPPNTQSPNLLLKVKTVVEVQCSEV